MTTEKETIIIEHMANTYYKYGMFAEQIPEILGWDMSVRYPDRRYRLPAYALMQRLANKGIVRRYYDIDTKKHLGYYLI
jgi:hypothetical protein